MGGGGKEWEVCVGVAVLLLKYWGAAKKKKGGFTLSCKSHNKNRQNRKVKAAGRG